VAPINFDFVMHGIVPTGGREKQAKRRKKRGEADTLLAAARRQKTMVLAGGLDSCGTTHVLLLRTRTCAAQQVAKSPETQPGPVPPPRHLLTIHARTPLQNGTKPPAAASFFMSLARPDHSTH
jgi:hypothetical protein